MFPVEMVERLKTHAANDGKFAALTGAGFSKESGIPTFREAQTGLWALYEPAELATPQAFRQNPKMVWEWYEWRRGLVSQAEPNPGHIALAKLEDNLENFTLITQNVDGLHQRAGSNNPIELHGNIMRTKCFDEEIVVEEWENTDDVPPSCPHCRGMLRPDVVWFGESLPPGALNISMQAAQETDVFFSVGTSAVVQPAASLPLYALNVGAMVIEINPEKTPISHQVQYHVPLPSGEALPELMRLIWR